MKSFMYDHQKIRSQQALVIGVDQYRPGFPALDSALHDATAIATLLENDYGFELLPYGEPLTGRTASLTGIRRAVVDSLERASGATRWLFYFAGHGLFLDGQGYLLPSNAIIDRTDSYLPVRWLLDRCLQSACGEILVLLDACYSGQALIQPDDLSDLIPKSQQIDYVCQLISSGNPDQPVLDGSEGIHSVFATLVLDVLGGWAGIHEEDGRVRFPKLLDFITQEVPRRLRVQGLSTTKQQPLGGNLVANRSKRDFTFYPIAPRLSPEIVRGLQDDDPDRRCENLPHLLVEYNQKPETKAFVLELALRHLHSDTNPCSHLITPYSYYEPAAAVRAQAAIVLREVADRRATDPLIAALDDVPQVCREAACALEKIEDSRAAPAILKQLRHRGDELFLDLIDAILALEEPGTTFKALREGLLRAKVVPFIGPDFPKGLSGLPDRKTLAHKLTEIENQEKSDSLAKVAATTMIAGNRFRFTEFLKREIDSQLLSPGVIHKALAHLDIPVWISGAYDGLLTKALDANEILSGEDTLYVQFGRPNIVRLVGDIDNQRALVVVEDDYKMLREGEDDRNLLLAYLRGELQGKAVLFLGYDPYNPDFDLLMEYVFQTHLKDVDLRGFLVWPGKRDGRLWKKYAIQRIRYGPLAFINGLVTHA